jgi:hypothetical protein
MDPFSLGIATPLLTQLSILAHDDGTIARDQK